MIQHPKGYSFSKGDCTCEDGIAETDGEMRQEMERMEGVVTLSCAHRPFSTQKDYSSHTRPPSPTLDFRSSLHALET